MSSPPLLAARGVVRIDPASGRPLLAGASLEIAAGHRILLQGPSGSGKTLLLRALALLDRLHEGEIAWRGEPIADRDVPRFRSQVLYLQQRPTLIAGSVADNLELAAAFRWQRKAQDGDRGGVRDRSGSLLRRLGRPTEFLDRSTDDLSGGERQIVAFLRALLLEPTILLLDEPTAALDPDAEAALVQLVDGWFAAASSERAYLWVRHGQRRGERRETRQLRLDAGRLSEMEWGAS